MKIDVAAVDTGLTVQLRQNLTHRQTSHRRFVLVNVREIRTLERRGQRRNRRVEADDRHVFGHSLPELLQNRYQFQREVVLDADEGGRVDAFDEKASSRV